MGILKILILVAVGGLFFVKVLKKPVLGHVWVGIVIGIVGGVLGGFFLNQIVLFLAGAADTMNKLDINFIATLLGAFGLVWVFSKVSVQ